MNGPEDYDALKCELPLLERRAQFADDPPAGWKTMNDNVRTWQTKSIPPVGGNNYVITWDGYLAEDMNHRHNEAGLRPLMNFTGEVRFYDIVPDGTWRSE